MFKIAVKRRNNPELSMGFYLSVIHMQEIMKIRHSKL